MDKEKVIEVLDDLIVYIEEEWDSDEYGEDIKLNVTALTKAIEMIKSGNVVGSCEIEGKKYNIVSND